MPTRCTSGSSTQANGAQAVAEAVQQAQAALGGGRANLGFIFASAKHKLQPALSAAAEVAPGTQFLGCTTAGEITERGLTHGGVSVLLIQSDELVYDVALASAVKQDHVAAAAALTARFAATAASARAKKLIDSTTVTLIDGLCGVGEKVVGGIIKGTRSYQQVVGGAAGDDGQFKATHVGVGREAGSDTAAALHVFSPSPWGVGVNHGLKPSTGKMVVTKSKGNVVYEIDGKRAFDVYKDYAKTRGVTLTPENAGPFMINNELGVYFLSQLQRARAPLAVGQDGSLACAADIAEGSSVSILDGKPDDLVSAARAAAEEAKEALQGKRPAAVLLFDCICRGTILDKQFHREIESVKSVFPSVPIVGFLTYGEIARYKGRLDGWHNTTAVVTAIPA